MEPRFARELAFLRFTQHPDNVLWASLFHQHQDSLPRQQQHNNSAMGRPKDFPNIYDDLMTKYKAKGIADKEYKEYLAMARVSWLLNVEPFPCCYACSWLSSPDACVPSLCGTGAGTDKGGAAG